MYVIVCIIIALVIYMFAAKKHKKKTRTLRVPDVSAAKIIRVRAHCAAPVIEKSDVAYYTTRAAKVAKTYAAIKLHKTRAKQQRDNLRNDLHNYDLRYDLHDEYDAYEENNALDFTTDAQNIHDNTVQNTTQNKYNALVFDKSVASDKSDKSNKSDKIAHTNEILRCAGDKAPQVQSVLAQLQQRNSFISNLQTNEVCVLNNAWSAASADVKQQIVLELLDARDGNHLVCPTGVVSRIINADVVEHPEASPRTAAQLRAEMLTSAGAVRTALEGDTAYVQSTPEQQSNLLQAALVQKYSVDYAGIISQEKIQSELDTWLAYV